MKKLIPLLLILAAASAWAAEIEEVIVTAQRTAESIQDVPIAVTALQGEQLVERQIMNTTDLQRHAPNVSFTPTNFGANSFSIRGIGRLLTAATGDAGVSVHTNQISVAPNLNTSEFYDMERIEILRGPQGTLFGKNATGGVVNFVTRMPDFDSVNGFVDIEGGNFENRRLKGAVNIPLADNFAVRVAGMKLDREGYTRNLAAGRAGADGRILSDLDGGSLERRVDGRNQDDYRITAAWDMTDNASMWVMFTHQEEDSSRARVTNQVCTTNGLPTYGCEPDGKGREQPHNTSKLGPVLNVLYGLYGVAPDGTGVFNWERPVNLSLRDMHSDMTPVYRTDVDQYTAGFEYRFDRFSVEITGGYYDGYYFTQQDYNMDVGNELPTNFFREDGAWPLSLPAGSFGALGEPGNPCNLYDGNAGVPGGTCVREGYTHEFTFDQADSAYEGWTYEVKLQSQLDGWFNFLLGYTQFDHEATNNYYVLGNTLDARVDKYPGFFDNFSAPNGGTFLDGYAFFGEAYVDLSDRLKLTFGLRTNTDNKEDNSTSVLWNATDANFPLSTAAAGSVLEPLWTRIPGFVNGAEPSATELALINLYAPGANLDAAAATGAQSPERLAISELVPLAPGFSEARVLTGSPSKFDWRETTGRVGVDWQMTDNNLLYAFYSRGYKPGGANPAIPPQFQSESSFSFEQEDIDAFEIGAKNTFLDGGMVLNAALFWYDYEGLQVARIKNNTSLNENIDAEILGAEVELFWRPDFVPGLEVNLNYSWLDSEVVDTVSVDPTNRTAGNPDWMTLNGIGFLYAAPRDEIIPAIPLLLSAGVDAGAVVNHPNAIDPETGVPVIVARGFLDAIGVTNVEGLPTDLDGNQLPNSPEHTIKLGLSYEWALDYGSLTFRWDYYWQDDSYAREFNTVGDEIDSWDQHDLSLLYVLNNWNMRVWVRNIQDEDNVTGHYLTSDTSGYFRNYFLTEPRVYGLSVRYEFE